MRSDEMELENSRRRKRVRSDSYSDHSSNRSDNRNHRSFDRYRPNYNNDDDYYSRRNHRSSFDHYQPDDRPSVSEIRSSRNYDRDVRERERESRDNNKRGSRFSDEGPRSTKQKNREKSHPEFLYKLYDEKHYTDDLDDPIWDFTVPHEVQFAGIIPKKIKPNPEIEYVRYKEISKLREHYRDLCSRILFIEDPSESFNRWLFEQLSQPDHLKIDEFLSRPESLVKSEVLSREIISSLPAPAYLSYRRRESISKVVETIQDYCDNSINWISKMRREIRFNRNKELTKEEGARLDKARDLLIKAKTFQREEIISLNSSLSFLEALSTEIRRILEPVLLPRTQQICSDLLSEAKVALERIQDTKESTSGTVILSCSPEQQVWNIEYRGDKVTVTKRHYTKLRTLFMLNHPDDRNDIEYYHICLYVLLRRYATFFGNKEGATFHAASPSTVFRFLKTELGVCQENFASPLNCYFRNFNSAFPAIDVHFGSLGSFFDFKPTTGSFETGPPYTEEVMDRMATHIEVLLSSSELPLSFVVFVPDWQTPPSPGLVTMDLSKYKRAVLLLKGGSYEYVLGNQHTTPDRHFVLPFDTRLFFLQNDAGSQKWPVTDQIIERFQSELTTKFCRKNKIEW
jgi:phosphorylated CTD-interacting factor 1